MDEYIKTLEGVYRRPRSFQSDYCRLNASLVAEAASRGHLTCLDGSGRNVGQWMATAHGVRFLKRCGRIR